MKKNKNMLLLVLFLFSFSCFFLVFYQLDPDYFWHIKAGEYMFHHGILRKDIFSWIVLNKYWMSHEWLFEIILYIFKLIFSSWHVLVYSFLCIFSLLIVIFLPNRNSLSKNIIFTITYFMFFFFTFVLFVQARPFLISYILFALSFYILYDLYKNEESKKIFFLPLITVLWSNLHGGSSNFPYLLCLLFIVCGCFSFNTSKMQASRLSKIQFKKYIIIMFFCIIAVCINAHGFRMFLYPYQNIMDSTMISNIGEWRATSFKESFHYVFYLFVLFLLFTMLFSKKKIVFMDFLIFLFFTYLGLKSVRFWAYLSIVMPYIIFSYVSPCKKDYKIHYCIIASSAMLFSFFILQSNRIFSISYHRSIDEDVISLLRKYHPKKLFNMYDFGGELIFHNIPVFVDGRADLYGKYNYKDYLSISNLTGDYVETIDKYAFDYFLVFKDYSINTYLKYNVDYSVIYENEKTVLYKKIAN